MFKTIMDFLPLRNQDANSVFSLLKSYVNCNKKINLIVVTYNLMKQNFRIVKARRPQITDFYYK